jgi:hypothetical protein
MKMFAKLLVMTAVALNAAVGMAENTSVTLQAAKVAQLEEQLSSLRQDARDLEIFSKALGEAKRMEGIFRVTFTEMDTVIGLSTGFLTTSSTTAWGMSVTKNLTFSANGFKPTVTVVKVSGIALAAGILVKAGSAYYLNIAEGDKIEAEQNIANVKSVMESKKDAIKNLAQGLGATVNENIITGLPAGLSNLVNGGGMLNLNNLK